MHHEIRTQKGILKRPADKRGRAVTRWVTDQMIASLEGFRCEPAIDKEAMPSLLHAH